MKHLGVSEIFFEMAEAGFTEHERRNERLVRAVERLLCRGRLYYANDDVEIEHGVSGPFNDDEGRTAAKGESDA